MEQIYLRALESDDLLRTHKWHSDQNLYTNLGNPYRYVSQASEENWINKKIAYSSSEVNLAICLVENSQHIGNIYLQDIDWVARRAELGMLIGESENQCKGYGTDAMMLAIRHAFQDLGLQRIYLHVLDDNHRAVRVYEKCGFVVEGKLRRHTFKQGKFMDVLIMGLCTEN